MNLRTLARYPLLPETSAYLKGIGISLDSLVNHAAYEQVRHAGRRRVMEALVDGHINEYSMVSEADLLVELLSYVVARIIVSCTADEHLIQRYALAEAITTQKRLESEKLDFVIEMAVLMGMDAVAINATETSIHFTDYLRHSSDMRSEEWKLNNQELDRGRVPVSKDRLARLLQHAIKDSIEAELPLPVNDDIIAAFKNSIDLVIEEVARRKARFEEESYGRVSFLRLPPCMKKLLDMMKKGQNVPHVGRFALTSFLHIIGMTNDDIVTVFSSSPDFKEQLARYQIDHITGKTSGVEYLPPECSTMRTHGVCFDPDSLCKKKWLNHPLTYYRVKGKKPRNKSKAGEKAVNKESGQENSTSSGGQ
ncbi:MAG: DNA primase large subunit PriL [Candidatus Thermoplasmatota archaeon]|nr:DNA primase regulatory subunit PriL [Euryarchaeota archaeon]MBU4032373.1 DNA primase large subunit PriL [Candidatus Thermoplasmatota archaeon]MBU4070798.1 DNA primase large subunit PriL [Candidatus Thermoplasmatota archaeon]MBU4144798.1 DNA primase large subunit PriL [Candidatus Thermoplasmatota archaeon]MBU4591632.1 DNA primase large subunit PriL [Candidatus Thermoplasmatota archaeon]